MTTSASKLAASRPMEVSVLDRVLDPLEQLLDIAWREEFDAEHSDEIAERLRALHALVRSHEAVQQLSTAEQIASASPQHADELRRLLGEHTVLIGMLDRLSRQVEAMPNLPLEDKEVFYLRGRELIAALRRHEAEEDRLFFISLWHDTGGES